MFWRCSFLAQHRTRFGSDFSSRRVHTRLLSPLLIRSARHAHFLGPLLSNKTAARHAEYHDVTSSFRSWPGFELAIGFTARSGFTASVRHRQNAFSPQCVLLRRTREGDGYWAGKIRTLAGTGVGMTWPVSAFITAITLLRHPRNRRGWRASMAMLLGDSQGAVSIAAQP